ncbi:MAG: hypothetical protein AB8G15_07910 [Saprospiraceae bacterium]
MATKKLQLTAFARFFILMIVVAPLAYMGASYYNNQDGLQNLKDLFSGKLPSSSTTAVVEEPAVEDVREMPSNQMPATVTKNIPDSDTDQAKIKDLNDELTYKNRRIQELTEEVETLKNQLKEKAETMAEQRIEMDKIQQQLDLIKKAASGGE